MFWGQFTEIYKTLVPSFKNSLLKLRISNSGQKVTGKTCINAAVYQLDSMFVGTVRYSPTMTYASLECPQDLSLSLFQCHMTVRDTHTMYFGICPCLWSFAVKVERHSMVQQQISILAVHSRSGSASGCLWQHCLNIDHFV